jgi:pimeloyl-ACP methyl ester carboxylesterase
MRKTLAVLIAAVMVVGAVAAGGCSRKNGRPVSLKPDTETIQVGDITVAYRIYGSAKSYPLIMIMGFSGTQDTWDPTVLRDLAREYRVITFDNRGMGESTTGYSKFTIPQFADDTAGLMQALSIKQANVLGWSMGTYIAQELVLRHPGAVNKLVLYAADCGGTQAIKPQPSVVQTLMDPSGTFAQRGERLIQLLFPAPWLAKKSNRAYLMKTLGASPQERSPSDNAMRQGLAIASWDGSYDRLPAIISPTLLVTGTEDIIIPPGNSGIIASRISVAWTSYLRGGGHGVMLQYPREFARILLGFMASP